MALRHEGELRECLSLAALQTITEDNETLELEGAERWSGVGIDGVDAGREGPLLRDTPSLEQSKWRNPA